MNCVYSKPQIFILSRMTRIETNENQTPDNQSVGTPFEIRTLIGGNNQENNVTLLLARLLEGHQRFLEEGQKSKTSDDDDFNQVYKRMTDFKLEFYDGLGYPSKFKDWVSSMEKLFDMAACPDNQKVKFATYYLKGEADLWWKTVKNVRDQPNFDWKNLQVLMRK